MMIRKDMGYQHWQAAIAGPGHRRILVMMSLRCSGIADGLCDGRLANHREFRNALGLSPTFHRGLRDPRLPSWRVRSAGPALVKLLCRTAAHPKAHPFIVAFRGCRHLPKRPCSGAVGEDWTLMRCQRGVSVRGLQGGPRITTRIRIRTVARDR